MYYVHYSTSKPDQIQYKSVYLNKNHFTLEDDWLIKFIPSFEKELSFLSLEKFYELASKPFLSDRMNQNAINNKDKYIPDMLLYFNFVLSA